MNVLTATEKSAFRQGNRGETEDAAEPYLARGHDGDGARQVTALVTFLPQDVTFLSSAIAPISISFADNILAPTLGPDVGTESDLPCLNSNTFQRFSPSPHRSRWPLQPTTKAVTRRSLADTKITLESNHGYEIPPTP
jgi:hypothetical protein